MSVSPREFNPLPSYLIGEAIRDILEPSQLLPTDMLRLRTWTRSLRADPIPIRLAVSKQTLPPRTFTSTPILPAKPLPARLKINDADLTISYLKGTGPGGQKIVRTLTGKRGLN